jgi:uncharacterized protein (DUF433 family)
MSISVLDRELYDVPLAAEVLHMPASTLQWWLEGGQRRGKRYDPVIRPAPTGNKAVTWGELVEARYLLGYRRDLRVKLSELRQWMNLTRQQLGVPYPLAHQQPWVGPGRQILATAQITANLPEELWAMWVARSGQILLTAPAESFLEQVDFGDDQVVRLHPAGRRSPVVIDPLVRFGAATVHGIPTQAIAEQVEAGDPIEMVADDFGLALTDVIAVLNYEVVGPDMTAVAAAS